jgi:predicted phage terminase large subunit-like protein
LIFNHQIHPYSEVGVEDDIFEMISKDLTSQLDRAGVSMNVRKRASRNLPNKTARINSMEGRVTAGVIKFRKDWKTAPNNYHLLIEQLQSFGMKNEHDDAPDALEGAVWLALGGNDPKFWFPGERKLSQEEALAEVEKKKTDWEKRNAAIVSGADERD